MWGHGWNSHPGESDDQGRPQRPVPLRQRPEIQAMLPFERLGLLRLALPDARFIHCRRHPVDTCLSIFFEPFSGAESYACDRGDLVFAYRQYERLMEHWRGVLPPDRFTEVR